MKDCATILRKQYYDTIKAITVSAAPIQVYDAIVPDSAPNNYVLLNQQTESRQSNKTATIINATITIDVVHWQQRTNAKKIVETYSNPILQAIDNIKLSLGPDFEMISSRVSNTATSTQNTDERVYSIKSITFEHIIIQL